jgi:hypothetical protein
MTITKILFDSRFKFELNDNGFLFIHAKQPELIEHKERAFIRQYIKTIKNFMYMWKDVIDNNSNYKYIKN